MISLVARHRLVLELTSFVVSIVSGAMAIAAAFGVRGGDLVAAIDEIRSEPVLVELVVLGIVAFLCRALVGYSHRLVGTMAPRLCACRTRTATIAGTLWAYAIARSGGRLPPVIYAPDLSGLSAEELGTIERQGHVEDNVLGLWRPWTATSESELARAA